MEEISDKVRHGFYVNKDILFNLVKSINAESLRYYSYNIITNSFTILSIYGNQEGFSDVEIKTCDKNFLRHDSFLFYIIKYITPTGKEIHYGYIGIRKTIISPKEDRYIKSICSMYAYNSYVYSVKRHNILIMKYLRNFNSFLKLESLPGKKMYRITNELSYITLCYRCLYCSINDTNWTPEYLFRKKNATICCLFDYFRTIVVDTTFLNNLKQAHEIIIKGSILPQSLQDFFFRKETRDHSAFNCKLFPVNYEGDLIGVWIIAYHKYQNDDFYDENSFLQMIYSSMKLTYKYIYQRSSKKMIINPIFIDRDTRIKEKDVFVIMPFSEPWSNDLWKSMIIPVVESMGLTPIRADDLYGRSIMEDIWKGILHSAIVIADITGRNPNVLYELGIAHTLGKKVILLTQNVKDIPFDLQHLRHIIYNNTFTGGNELRNSLINHINEQLHSDSN